ncbi:MAG TPA: hypothetical protein VFR84_15710 [Candidatus Angelobacter sp.]|nr:hypothetical protein [Candidatus Angelobacter sp.]
MIKPSNPHLITTVKCAGPGCSNVRRESNHWFLIAVAAGRFICRPYLPEQGLKSSDQPVCGQACAQKLFDRFLARAPV